MSQQSFTDQLGRDVKINFPPKRIISLVPSQTELLYSLGLTDEVVGITKFCIHPYEWFKTKTRVGGTKQYDFEKIKLLQPDLIIGNKEENDEVQIKALMQQFPVWMSDIKTMQDALQMILNIGEIVNRKNEATVIANNIETNFLNLKTTVDSSKTKKQKALYCIWYNPLMAAGSDTFINEMLGCCGFANVLQNAFRYPEITVEKLRELNPEVVLLSSEPFPFKQKHIDELQLHCPTAKVILVDGEYFSWYGPRLIEAPKYFETVLIKLSR